MLTSSTCENSLSSPNIAVVGGGSGTSAVVRELKYHTEDISAIVAMCDNSGDSGELIRQGRCDLPPGDIRKCQAALSTDPEQALYYNQVLSCGPDAGHKAGNISIVDAEARLGSLKKSVEENSKRLKITGQVIPVTFDPHTLAMDDGAKEPIRGESNIDKRKFITFNPRIWLEGHTDPNLSPEAEEALNAADLIVIAPGSLHTSLLPTLAIRGMRSALHQSAAPIAMVTNLVNEPGQYNNWHAVDYIHAIEEYAGPGTIDMAIYNTQAPSRQLADQPRNKQELTDTSPSRFNEVRARAMGTNLLSLTTGTPFEDNIKEEQPEYSFAYDTKALSRLLIKLARE